MPLALEKSIDIGVVGNEDAQVFLREIDLFTLIKKLVTPFAIPLKREK
ncbi:hypothetical protein LIN78_16475 [Leeia sp. TBRC 13508]|uniref:Ribosomal protein S2 n=1 Tax=Leeia speluncae TaxID=2884804 RepID=A0ABS8DAB5_9NEIS|nr:hypothetical protein [Leeia speluncae]MCB6185145.1 hypothetical protein [Leeia speluncae]